MAVYDMPLFQPSQSLLSTIHNIPKNPQLPQTPMGAYTDSIFEALDAQLKAQYQRKFNDLQQQLGYIDDKGNIIQGTIESDANRQRADLWRNKWLAATDAINSAQQAGNYFSGYYAIDRARKEQPFVQAMADLDVSVPKQLNQVIEQMGQSYEDYNLQRNQGLADAAARQADAARQAGAGGTPPDSGQGPTTPAPDPYSTPPAGAPPSPGPGYYWAGDPSTGQGGWVPDQDTINKMLADQNNALKSTYPVPPTAAMGGMPHL
jgi:hypothetical protein